MPKQSCSVMLEDLLYEAVDAGASGRNVDPHMIGHFHDRCMRGARGGLGRRKRVVRARRRTKRSR